MTFPVTPLPTDHPHRVPAELDAAYTRNVAERFDGLTHPPDHDGVPTTVEAWGAHDPDGYLEDVVHVQVADAGIRLDFGPDEAEHLALVLLCQAARARNGILAYPAPLADACPVCDPGAWPAVSPWRVDENGDRLVAYYWHGACGNGWITGFDRDAAGWPAAREVTRPGTAA